MNIGFPQQNVQISDDSSRRVSGTWYRWLGNIYKAVGLDVNRPVYNRKVFSSLDLANLDSLSVTNYEGTAKLVDFAAGSTELLYFSFELPKNYRQGTAITPYIRWAPVDGSAGDVVWQLAYTEQPDEGQPVSEITSTLTSSSNEVSEGQIGGQLSAFTPASGAKTLTGTIGRLGGDTSDTYAQDALLFVLGFIYQINGQGEESVTV